MSDAIMDVDCYDCGLPYGDPKFPDLLIPNNVWELISPSEYRGAGLLCPNCIIGRCEELGLINIPFLFASGPFSFGIDLNKEF